MDVSVLITKSQDVCDNTDEIYETNVNQVYNFILEHFFDNEKAEPFECEICGYIARTRGWLRTHEIVKHGNTPVENTDFDEITELTCRKCIFEASFKDEMVNHVQDVHGPSEDFQCSVCDFITKSSKDLVVHVQAYHKVPIVEIKPSE